MANNPLFPLSKLLSFLPLNQTSLQTISYTLYKTHSREHIIFPFKPHNIPFLNVPPVTSSKKHHFIYSSKYILCAKLCTFHHLLISQNASFPFIGWSCMVGGLSPSDSFHRICEERIGIVRHIAMFDVRDV
eukprot:1037791_1